MKKLMKQAATLELVHSLVAAMADRVMELDEAGDEEALQAAIIVLQHARAALRELEG